MESSTASEIASKWLNAAGVISPPLDRVATALERVIPDPEVWDCTVDGQLVVLTRNGLWVGTTTRTTQGDLQDLKIERFDLQSVRAVFTQSYSGDSPNTSPEWRFEVGNHQLTFRAGAPIDEPISFGSQVADALGS